MDRFEKGDFVQLEPGNADPKNWAIILEIQGDNAKVAHYLNGKTRTIEIARLYRPEAPGFLAAIRAFFTAMFGR